MSYDKRPDLYDIHPDFVAFVGQIGYSIGMNTNTQAQAGGAGAGGSWIFSVKLYGYPPQTMVIFGDHTQQEAWAIAKHYISFAGMTIKGFKHPPYHQEASQ